jgi:hypothetical protein
MSSYCPNCSAELASTSIDECWNCGALFAGNGWRPTVQPNGTFKARIKPESVIGSEAISIANPSPTQPWQYVLGFLLLLIAAPLLFIAFKAGGNGGVLFAIPALLPLFTGIAVLAARSELSKGLSAVAGFLTLLLFVSLFFMKAPW